MSSAASQPEIERLRALLAQPEVHDPPWSVTEDDFDVYITGKRGPGWYDKVTDDVANRETADLIVAAVNALPMLLQVAEAAAASGPIIDAAIKAGLVTAVKP